MWPSRPCLAVSAVERYLIRTKKCTAVSIVLESAEPRDVNHFATLLGYGARAVNPYLAHAAIGSLIDQGLLDKDYHTAVKDYNQAILSGIVKIAPRWVSPPSSPTSLPRSSRQWALTGWWWTSISLVPSAGWGAWV